jgi:TldD protein
VEASALRPSHPSQQLTTIHEFIGHATELDRALGYEANYAGTSFATIDNLNKLRKYGSKSNEYQWRSNYAARPSTASVTMMKASKRSSGTLLKMAVLVGYQLDRRIRPALIEIEAMAAPCRFTEPCPNERDAKRLAIKPNPTGPTFDELVAMLKMDTLISRVITFGQSICNATTSNSMGQQFHRIVGDCWPTPKDVAYQATTTDFWRSMKTVGGPSTHVPGGVLHSVARRSLVRLRR